jgi:hypothetical protein
MSEVAKEVAEDEFTRMVESYDLDLDGLDKEDDEAFKALKQIVVRAIIQGRLTVDESGLPTVHLKYPVGEITAVKFKHVTGEMVISQGDLKAKNTVSQGWKFLQDLTGTASTAFGKMRQLPDLKTCNALARLFLG